MSPTQVLVVDDDLTSLLILQRMIRDLGFECETAANGAEAVEAANKKNFCAVFMDYMMPVMNGCDAAEKIKDMRNDGVQSSLIIGMISLDDPATRSQCQNSGMSAVLCKPIDRSALARCLCPGRFREMVEKDMQVCTYPSHAEICDFHHSGSRNSPAALHSESSTRLEGAPEHAGFYKAPRQNQDSRTANSPQALAANTTRACNTD